MTMIQNIVSTSTGKALSRWAIVLGMASLLAGCSSTHPSAAKGPSMPEAPFDAMVIRHAVADYGKWRPLFDADALFRDTAGLHLIEMGRGILNPNDLEIPFFIDSVPKAKAFGADPRLKEVMQKGGVIGAPDIKYIRVLRLTEVGKKPVGSYVSLTHKVKDFDAWLKVFDREGAAVRAKDGLIDVVLARGIDDPNLVYLVFKIKSVDEVNAAMADPARQKLIEEGNVVGKPEFFFGRDE